MSLVFTNSTTFVKRFFFPSRHQWSANGCVAEDVVSGGIAMCRVQQQRVGRKWQDRRGAQWQRNPPRRSAHAFWLAVCILLKCRDSEITPLRNSETLKLRPCLTLWHTAGMKMPMKTMAAATNRARFQLEIDVPASKETNMRLCQTKPRVQVHRPNGIN